MNAIKNPDVRRWLYGIATAVLLVLGGYGIVDTVAQQNLGTLAAAVLNIGGAGATALAARKTTLAPSDAVTPVHVPDSVAEAVVAESDTVEEIAVAEPPVAEVGVRTITLDLSEPQTGSIEVVQPTATSTDPALNARHGAL